MRTVVVGTTGSIPLVGGTLQFLANEYLPSSYQRRLQVWFEELEGRIGRLEDSDVADERTATAIFRATQIAVATHVSDRIAMLGAAVASVAEAPEKWEDPTISRYFSMIERFSAGHIEAMKLLDDRMSGSVPKDPEPVVVALLAESIIVSSEVDRLSVARDLAEFGLVDLPRASGRLLFGDDPPGWYSASSLSVDGQLFLRFIQELSIDEPLE